MAQILIRNLDDEIKQRLERRARRHGRSTVEEVRQILRLAVLADDESRTPLGSRLAERFARIGLEEDVPELRGQPGRAATFEP